MLFSQQGVSDGLLYEVGPGCQVAFLACTVQRARSTSFRMCIAGRRAAIVFHSGMSYEDGEGEKKQK